MPTGLPAVDNVGKCDAGGTPKTGETFMISMRCGSGNPIIQQSSRTISFASMLSRLLGKRPNTTGVMDAQRLDARVYRAGCNVRYVDSAVKRSTCKTPALPNGTV